MVTAAVEGLRGAAAWAARRQARWNAAVVEMRGAAASAACRQAMSGAASGWLLATAREDAPRQVGGSAGGNRSAGEGLPAAANGAAAGGQRGGATADQRGWACPSDVRAQGPPWADSPVGPPPACRI